MAEEEQIEEQENTLEAFSDTNPDPGLSEDALSDLLRIEENLPISWHGVRGCCDSDRVNSEVKQQFEAWLGRQVSAHSDRTLVNWGHGGGTANCSSSTGPWPNNDHHCRGGATITAFAEFAVK